MIKGNAEKQMSNLQHSGQINTQFPPELFDSLCQCIKLGNFAGNEEIYKKEMLNLTSKENGFHFLTAKMAQQQLRNFNVEDIMNRMMVIGAQATMTSFLVYKA